MYYTLSLLTGILISFMVAMNGGLSQQHGLYTATVMIHIMGLLLISAIIVCKRENPFAGLHKWFLYTAGALGVMMTLFNNFAFGRISLSAILALGLLGQSMASLVIDQTGWMGMHKHPFRIVKLTGLLVVSCGIAIMLDRFELLSVILSLIAGVIVVISRTLNAKLSELSSIRTGTFFNYLVGLLVSLPVFLILGSREAGILSFAVSADWHIYFGGFLGVCVVLLSNMTVMKISALYLSLLVFVGQVFAGMVIDAWIDRSFSVHIMLGGMLVTAGLCINLITDHTRTHQKRV
jgi:transporter family-2 protein